MFCMFENVSRLGMQLNEMVAQAAAEFEFTT
jgi:hypothetical protein